MRTTKTNKNIGIEYFIENASQSFYLNDIIKINPVRQYLFSDVKKTADGTPTYPGGYLIFKILNNIGCIHKGGSGTIIILDANKDIELELSELPPVEPNKTTANQRVKCLVSRSSFA